MEEKTFFIEDEQTNKSELLSWPIPKAGNLVDLQELLKIVPNMNKKIFKIFNPQKNQKIKFGGCSSKNHFKIPRRLLGMAIVIIKFNSIKLLEENSDFSESEDSHKKFRSQERTIREVIELIEKWRTYHKISSDDGKIKTLQDAAVYVGVSKKSLDDYYYQLRVGEKYEFDFTAHLEDKIGVLRAFTKIKEPSRKAEGRNSKQPKDLRIIEEFSAKLKIKQTNENPLKAGDEAGNVHLSRVQPPSYENLQIIHTVQDPFASFEDESQIFWGSPFTPLNQEKEFDCEKNFYNSFGLNFEDPSDPYLNLVELVSRKSYSCDEEIL